MGASINDILGSFLPIPEDCILGYVIAALIQCALILQVIAVGALVFIWMERKIAGRIQDRLGPTRIGGSFGWLQTLADGIKLIAKEDVTPRGADWVLFKFAPYIGFAASFCAFIALPFANGWVGQDVNTAAFFVLAVLGLEVFSVILAGYASASKWSLFGGMREAAQVVSYEVPLGICVIIPIMLAGSMNLTVIANAQAGLFTNWYIFHDPFTFMTFWVYFTCAVASVNRAPFDLAEAESELVAGFHTEYSGLRWSFFFMAEYGSMFLVSGLAAILFFGGWHGPIPILTAPGIAETGAVVDMTWTQIGANVIGCTNFIIKAVIGVTVMMWVRWTFPRLRIDQVLTTCLKYCVPLASIGFVGVLVWQALGWYSLGDILPANKPGSVHESWVVEANLPAATIDATEPDATPEEPAETPAEANENEAEEVTGTETDDRVATLREAGENDVKEVSRARS